MGIVQHLDNVDLTEFTKIAAAYGQGAFGYVVTPNVDHVIRYHDEPRFRSAYADAAFVLLDSRFLAYVVRATMGLAPRVCTGSDLTAKLFGSVVRPNDQIVLIGGSTAQAAQLAKLYKLQCLQHFNPPMGFINRPTAVEECMQFIESMSPFRFCLLAVGSPQQEYLAQQLKARGVARGLALCIGASINFLTGIEQRAPQWMQSAGLEWLYRLACNPSRMARRYLIRGPRIFLLLGKVKIVLRRA